jgi:tight adherence protein C
MSGLLQDPLGRPVLLLLGGLLILTGLTGLRSCNWRDRLVARLALLGGSAGPVAAPAKDRASLLGTVGAWFAGTPLVGSAERERLRRMLAAAGYTQPFHLYTLAGAKLLSLALGGIWALLVLGDLTAGFGSTGILVGVMAGALLGWRVPDLVLGLMRDRRLEDIRTGLPDALDLLVICAEAGIGLEAAIDRVAREIASAYPALGAELAGTAAEMRVLSDRGAALSNLAARVDIEGVRGMATTLIQAMRYGTPLAQALRILAAEMRTHRLARFEEKAARLPVLLTLPMVVFILPCVFIVVGGPAVIDILAMFSAQGVHP